ncbi:hypothetical protein EQY69_07525 [Clostridium perfringens]|nr:hypothetical protein [Clostridium perfringens]
MENLTLDFNNLGSRVGLGTYEKCDSLTLTIMLDEKDYTGYKFKILAKKSDGHIIEQDIKEQDINREEKTIKTELNNQFTTKEGVVKLEINMIKEGKEDTTKEAFFIVRDTINGEVVESTSIIPTLEGVKVFIDEAVSSLGDLEQAGEDIALINGEFKEAEIKRKSSELLRERSEKERVRLESIRTTEEADRIKAEAERKEAENNRKVAESNRKLNENTRKTNEAARVEAELNRQNTFEENEEIRNENEKLRIEAEKQRKLTFSNNNKFESERVEAEKLRVAAEDKRVTSEKARAKAEEERIKAETRREGTYTDFNDSEVERKNNEANRVRAEAERVNAESGRNELFNTNEEKRNNTFVESERARERAFNEAQTNRSEAYEESERVREEAFKVSEAARNEAEEARKETELLRVEAENNREVAEAERVNAESARVEAEKLRVSAETGRVEAENLRVTAEEGRVEAETKREEGFNAFEGKINANTEELKGARSATTGEQFNSLDERIDCEVDRINKKIEVSMLQQEDKGSHVVENSVEGMTTDMIVKGRTLQNLVKYQLNNQKVGGTSMSATLCTNEMFKINTTYTIIYTINSIESGTGKTTLNFSGGMTSPDITLKSSDLVGTHKQTFTLKTLPSTKYRNVSLYHLDSNTTKFISDVIIIEGEVDFTLNYFEGIKSFGQQEDKISILSHCFNLFNYKTMYTTDWIDGNGSIINSGDNKYYSIKVPIYKTNIKYYITGDVINRAIVGYLDADGRVISHKVYSPLKTIELDVAPKGAKYILAYLNAQGYDNSISNGIMLSIDTPSEYLPYSDLDKKDILLSQYGFDEGLRGLNNIVYDELNSITDKAIKKIEKYSFTGNENLERQSINEHGIINFLLRLNTVRGGIGISNKLKQQNTNIANTLDEGFYFSEGIGIYIRVKESVANDVDMFKQLLREWHMANNPLEIYYELLEPVEIPLNESIALKVYDEKTYVSFENAISGTSSFKVPVDTTATIARLNRENRALEEENVKLKKGTYINTKDISITKEELQATQSAVDFLLFNNLNAVGTAMLYNGKKEGGGSMGAYLAMRIIKGKLKYDAVMKQYGEFKEDIDLILEAEGYGHLITQQ